MELQKENKMGTMPLLKLIITMSLPMILSMLVQACYNVVDSIFIARYSDAALAAVSYAFPAQNLMIGVATGTGVGINALLSRSLGQRDFEKANRTAGNGIVLAVISSVVFFLLGITLSEIFISFQTDTAEVIQYGKEYLTICCCMSFGVFGEITFERLMQTTGRTILTMFTQGLGAIINIVLDPILIFGYFGLPEMGIAGAAWATVIGQIAAFILAIILNHKYNNEIQLTKDTFRLRAPIVKSIYKVGVPSILMVCIGSVMTTGVNKILGTFKAAYGDTPASVFGVYFKLQSFVFMPVFGLNNGVIPIIAYNYGAQKRKRMIGAIKIAAVAATLFMCIGLLIMQVFPEQALMLFDADESMLAIAVPALRTISISFIFAGVCIALGSVFQALGYGTYSMIVSFARQIAVLLPAAYLLSLSGKLNLVWLAFPIAELMSIAVTVVLFIRIYKKIISKIPD